MRTPQRFLRQTKVVNVMQNRHLSFAYKIVAFTHDTPSLAYLPFTPSHYRNEGMLKKCGDRNASTGEGASWAARIGNEDREIATRIVNKKGST